MTSKEIRDVGFLSWKDPDAWMESMRGQRWDALMDEENKRLHSELKKHTTPERIHKFKEEIIDAHKYYDLECFESGPIKITPLGTFSLKWRFDGETIFTKATDVFSDGKYVVYTHDIGKGAEKYELVCLDVETREVNFRKSPVGPNFSLDCNRLFYLGVKQKLWYNELFVCDIKTGKNVRSLYEEKDGHYNLSLIRQTYLVRENSGKTDTFHVSSNNTLTHLKPGSERQYPSHIHTNKCYYRMSETDEYKFIENNNLEGTPFATNLHHILTHKMGETFVYNHFGGKEFHIPQGTITLDTYGDGIDMRVDDGTKPPYILTFGKKIKPIDGFKLKTKKIEAKSSDGTIVHGTILYKGTLTRPKALLGVGYGAYGIPSSPAGCYGKWVSLIERGWGILYTYIRGGGDDSDAWATSGRLGGRIHTRDDFLALVETAQKNFKIPAARTVIYGRSAGGFLMGMCINKEPTGRLFSAVYTEVPYVDIIRTTTNKDLPLTMMEYNEFGDPSHRPEDFGFLVDLSPADVAITTEAPNVFVLARTGLNDSEVYAYEPVKWIRRLRKPGDKKQKVIGIDRDEGHFYSSKVASQAKAEDLAILYDMIFPS